MINKKQSWSKINCLRPQNGTFGTIIIRKITKIFGFILVCIIFSCETENLIDYNNNKTESSEKIKFVIAPVSKHSLDEMHTEIFNLQLEDIKYSGQSLTPLKLKQTYDFGTGKLLEEALESKQNNNSFLNYKKKLDFVQTLNISQKETFVYSYHADGVKLGWLPYHSIILTNMEEVL